MSDVRLVSPPGFRRKVWLVRIGVALLAPLALVLLAALAAVMVLNAPLLLGVWLWYRRHRDVSLLRLIMGMNQRRPMPPPEPPHTAGPAGAVTPNAASVPSDSVGHVAPVIPIRKGMCS